VLENRPEIKSCDASRPLVTTAFCRVYFISGAKVRAPAAAQALIARLAQPALGRARKKK